MTLTPPAHFALILANLARTVIGLVGGGVHPQRLDPRIAQLVHAAIRRIAARVASVLARLEAGTLRPSVPRQPRTADPKPTPPRRRPAAPIFPFRLRSDSGWLNKLTPHLAAYGGQLAYLFAAPNFQDLLDQAPQLRRILRPLMTMFGIEPQPGPGSGPGSGPEPDPPKRRRIRYMNPRAAAPPFTRHPRTPHPSHDPPQTPQNHPGKSTPISLRKNNEYVQNTSRGTLPSSNGQIGRCTRV